MTIDSKGNININTIKYEILTIICTIIQIMFFCYIECYFVYCAYADE